MENQKDKQEIIKNEKNEQQKSELSDSENIRFRKVILAEEQMLFNYKEVSQYKQVSPFKRIPWIIFFGLVIIGIIYLSIRIFS